MAAVQKRNSEMVDLLSADFVRKTDTAFVLSMAGLLQRFLPNLVGFWPMSIVSNDDRTLFGDWVGIDLTNIRLGIGRPDPTNPLDVVGNAVLYYPSDQRYVLGFQPLNNLSNILSYDTIAAAHTLLLMDGSTIKLRPNADDAKAFIVDTNGMQMLGRLGEAWQNLAYTNSGGTTWTDFGGGFAAGRYKKFGDMVYVQGLCKRTAGTGTIMATLPVGYRPPATVLATQTTDTGIFRYDVRSDGGLENFGGTGWVSLHICFSTI